MGLTYLIIIKCMSSDPYFFTFKLNIKCMSIYVQSFEMMTLLVYLFFFNKFVYSKIL